MNMLRYVTLAALVAGISFTQVGWAGDKDRKSTDSDKAGEKDKKDAPKQAEAKEIVINGELTNADLKDKVRSNSFSKTYTYRMVENKRYQIDMISTAFDSYLRLENPAGDNVQQDDDGGGFPNARMFYIAPKGGDYTIVCTSFGGGSTGKFTLIVRDITGKDPVNPKVDFKFPPKLDGPGFDKKVEPGKKVEAKRFDLKDKDGKAEFSGQITNDDGTYTDNRFGNRDKRSKLFTYQMEAGKSYRIDLSSKDFDAFLFLVDDAGKVLAFNDDNGESLDSRIIQKIDKAGKYSIVVTSLSGNSNGEFKLTVRPASDDEVKEASLRKQVEKLFTDRNADRQAIVQEVLKHLEGKGAKVNRGDLNLAMGVSQALEFARDNKVAGDAMKQFAKIFSKASDPLVVTQAKSMEGMARRLDLVGNTMEVKGKLIDGKEFDLKNLKGKVVLVDFWATWCGPCVQEIPHVKSLYEKYNKRGFEVVGISLDNTEDAVRKFNEDKKLPWGSIFNDSQKRGESLADHYGVMSIPLAILVGRDGRVVSLNARGPELTRLLEGLLEEKK